VISPAVSLAHATSTLKGLQELCDGLRGVPGSKTVLFLSTGVVVDGAESEAKAVVESAARSLVRVYSLQVPTSAPAFADQGRVFLRALAEDTGGALVLLSSKPELALQRMAGELSLSYLLMLVPSSGETLLNPLRLQVTSRRKNVTVRASRLAVPGRYVALQPGGMTSPAPRPPVRPPLPPPSRRSGAEASGDSPPDPELAPILARASEYVVGYERELSAVVAEEVYEQEWRSANGTTVRRRLSSDFLLVRIPGVRGWMPFRDVYEVDGEQVRDRADRLMKMFVEAMPERAIENARGIWEESARYNLGSVKRTVNVPVLPLMFLEPDAVHRFTYKKAGEDTIGGVRAWVIEYREIARPTIIKSTPGLDVPASGRFWIEPNSGRIMRTRLQASVADITVSYGPREELPGLWPPVLMHETYKLPGGDIQATATYSKFRRFQVSTQEQIKIPKRP
jgi:hypothetical protein